MTSSPSPSTSTIDYVNLFRIYQDNKLHRIATTALALGILIGINIPLLLSSFDFFKFKILPIYLIALSTFHFLEYYITAKYSFDKVNEGSYLINNGIEYHLAHFIAILEFIIEAYLFPDFKSNSYRLISLIGFIIVLLGQTIRSLAMIKAGESFSHLIAHQKKDNHALVTDGIYSIFRHPSYTGFFYWGIGTQLLLLNPVSTIGFTLVLFNFFNKRIKYEEVKLIEFFGDDYMNYKKRVNTKIPFIP